MIPYENNEVHPTFCRRCESLTCHEDAGRCGLCLRCQNEDMEAFHRDMDIAEQEERERQTERAKRSHAAVAVLSLVAASMDPMDDAMRAQPLSLPYHHRRARALRQSYRGVR